MDGKMDDTLEYRRMNVQFLNIAEVNLMFR